MMRAMWRLRLRGTLNRRDYSRFKAAIYSGVTLAGIDGTRPQFVIQHMRAEVQRLMVKGTAWDARYDFAGTIEAWFDAFSFDAVVTWIIENWQMIAQILVGLLVLLDAEYNAE